MRRWESVRVLGRIASGCGWEGDDAFEGREEMGKNGNEEDDDAPCCRP